MQPHEKLLNRKTIFVVIPEKFGRSCSEIEEFPKRVKSTFGTSEKNRFL